MSYRSAVLADSPALYWAIGYEAGGTHCWDESGHSRHGEYKNTPTFSVAGPLTCYPQGKAIGLAAASFQRVEVPSATFNPFTTGTTRTFECWGWVSPNSTAMRILGSTGTNKFRIRVLAEAGTFPCSIDFRPNSSTGTDVAWSSAWPAKESWVHLALVFNDSANTVELFINGESKGSKETTGVFGATPGNFSAGGDSSVNFNGRIAHAAVYEGALSATRVKAHYDAAGAAPVAPDKRIYWGALMDGPTYVEGQADSPYSETTTNTFKEHAGRKPGIIHFSDPITETGPTWDGYGTGASSNTHEYGAIAFKSIGGSTGIIGKVNEGATDAKWAMWAEAAQAFGRPMFLRPWWEMNGTWFAWGRSSVSAAEYKEAWKRVHGIVAPIAKNVTWVWCPNIVYEAAATFSSYYPGDAYVDWLGLDGYNEGTAGSGWKGSTRVFSESLAELTTVNATKPVILCESSAAETGGAKSDWFRDYLGQTMGEAFPQIKGYVHYNEKASETKPWQIESSTAAEEAFAAGIASELFVNPEVETFNKQTKVVAYGEPLPTPESGRPRAFLSRRNRLVNV